MTSHEDLWVARVMDMINRVSAVESRAEAQSCFKHDAGDDVLSAAQRLIQVLNEDGKLS